SWLNFAGSTPAFSATKLCAMATFGTVPVDLRTTWMVSPGLASIEVRLYFMSSPPVISTVRPAPAGFLAAAPAAGFAAPAGAAVVCAIVGATETAATAAATEREQRS